MGYSFHQFRALFWKNWLCRLRQPILSLSEVLWPCTLFLILAVVRFQEPPRQRENCYLEARDLPSRGLYPFVQSLFCNVGSRCKNRSYTTQKSSSFRASSFQHDHNSIMDPDMAFLQDVKELMQGISETTKKAATLQTLWEERSKLLDPVGSSVFLGINLNETEKIISTVEHFHNQPYFWDLLYSLPRLHTGNLSQEHRIEYLSKLLHTIQNSLAFLEDLNVMPSNQKSYHVLKLGLNVMTAVLETWNGEGFHYNLCLGDIMWNLSVKTELQSQLGFDKIYIERVLNYTMILNKIPTKDMLEQLVCTALSAVSDAESDKGGCNKRDCIIPPWLEAQMYLVHSVDRIKLYTKIFQQWITSYRPHKLFAGLEQSLVNFVSLYPKMNEIWRQCYNAGDTIIQYWNESLECNFPDDDCKPTNATLFLDKLQVAVQNLSQWPFVKTLFLVDTAVRNVTHQKLYFFKEALQNLENLACNTKREGFMHVNTGTLFVALRQILMNDASSSCNDDLIAFERSLGLPQDSEIRDVLEKFVCHQNHSTEASELRNRIHLVKESMQLLQSVIQRQHDKPVSIAEGYLGWQAIGEQLAETSACCSEIMKLLSKTSSVEDASFSFCQEQLIQSLFWDTLDELWFGLEKNFYWKGLSTIVRETCEMAFYANEGEGFFRGQPEKSEAPLCSKEKINLKAIIDNYIAFLQNVSNFPLTSWARIITSIKEFLKSEKTWPEHEEIKTGFVRRIAEFIQEIFLPNSSVSLNDQDLQAFVETILDNIVFLMNSLGTIGEEDVQIFPELAAQILENFQQLPTFRQHHQANAFLQMMEMFLHEFDPKQPHVWRTADLAEEIEEQVDALSRSTMPYGLENQKILNRCLQFFQHLLVYWPKLTVLNANYVNDLSEHFIKVLYETGLLSPEQTAAAFSTIYTVQNAISLLVSNTSSSLKMQDLEKIVSNFYQKISRVVGNHAARLVWTLSSLYQDLDQFLKQNNDSLVMFLYQNSKNNSVPFLQLDFRGVSETFEFISSTVKLLQDFPQKSFCEKLLMLYNHSELQVQSLVQETATTASIVNNSKAVFLGKERCIAAFQRLKTFFGLPTENSFHNVSSDVYISEFPSVNHSSSFMLLLAELLSSMPPHGNSTNETLSLNCTKVWIQTWLKFLEEMSKLLRLDSDFFADFHKALALYLDGLENSGFAKTCNKTIAVNEQMRSAAHLLKGIAQVADMIDFEALSHFSATLNHVINIISSYNRGDLQEVMHLVESITVELHKAVSNANFSKDFLESWLDIFTPASSKLEHKLHSLGKSISNILSWKEIHNSFVELRETAELLRNIAQDQNILSCSEILQNVTKLMGDEDLSSQNISQRWLPVFLKYLLTFENATIGMKSCHTLGLLTKTVIEKFSFFYTGNVKDILILLTSLSPFEDTGSKLENIPNILDVAFNFAKLPCLQNGTSALLINHCVHLVIKYLKLILPPFSEQDHLQEVDSVLTLLNYTGGQIKNITQYFKDYSYTPDSNLMTFLEPIMNSTEYLGFLHQFWPSSVGLEREIWTLLKNVSSEYFQDGVFPWHAGILLKALENLQKDIIGLLRAPLHSVDAILKILNMTSHSENDTSSFDPELARKGIQMLMSYILPSSVGELDADMLTNYMVTLPQDLEKKDANFSQLRQITRNLDFKENSVQDFLADWLKNNSNTPPLWNSTSMRQIMKLFQEAELTEVKQVLHFFLEVVSLFENAARKNLTNVLIEGYHLMLKQSANVAALSVEDLSNEVNSLVELLEVAASMPLESAKALSCLAAVMCWNITTISSWDELVSKACHVDLQKNSSTVHEVAAEILERLKTQGELPCSDEHFLKEVTDKMACFLDQLEEWHPIILTFSEIHPLDSSVLNELLTFWSKLSNYVLNSRANRSNLSHCMLRGKKQTSLQLIETISNMISSEVRAVGALFEQLANFYSSQKTERSTPALRTKIVLTHLRHVASGMFGFNDTKDALTSFLSSMYPPMALLPAGNQLHIVLKALLALARNISLRESLETLWLETERGIENLSSDFNVRHLLLLIAKEFHLLSTIVEPNTLSVLAAALRPLNASFLQSFEDVLEHGRNWLEGHNNKNYSKIIDALILLAAGKRSSNEIIQSIKDIISFLELFKNATKEDDPISFIIDFLSGKKLKNVQVAHLIFQNSLLNAVYDLTAKEEELHSNDTDNQIMEFIDLFFDDTQYENYGKDVVPSQSRPMELFKEFLQIVFPSSTVHYRNKIFFLLKDLHKDIIAEMSVFPRDKILALLNLDQLDNLNEEADDVTQNVTYSHLGDYINGLLNEAATMSTSGVFPFDGAKGLMFARKVFKLLLRNPAIKNITRSHEELLGFVNNVLYNVNNSQDLIQRIQDLSRTLPFMKHISTEIENLVGILAHNSLANIPEHVNFNNSIFLLKNSIVMSVVQRLLHIFGDSRAGYAPWPYLDIHDVLKSVFEENAYSKQVGKVIEVLSSFLMLSRKAAEQLATFSKIPASSNGTEDFNPLEMSFLALKNTVHSSIEEMSLKEEADMLYLNKGQLDSLAKAFLDLISLMIPLNSSSLKRLDTAVIEGESLSRFSDALEEEIAKCLTSALNYSIMLERLVELVGSSVASSSKEAFSLVENMLDFLIPINGMMRKNNSKLILTQSLKQEKGSNEIQKVISYLLERQSVEWEASTKAAASEGFWTNSSEKDLDILLTVLKRQDGIWKAFDIIMELIDFVSDFTNGDLSSQSFLSSPIVQNAVKLSVLPLLEKMISLIGLPHLNKNQKGNFIRELLQTVLRLLLNESIIEEHRVVNVKPVPDLVLPFQTYEKYTEHLIILVEQWLHDQRISEMCKALHKYLTPEGAVLLVKQQAAALNALTAISDDPAFMTNLQCIFKSCKSGFPRQFLFSLLEGIHLVQGHYQHMEKTLSSSTQRICENFVHLKKKLSATLAKFQRGLRNNANKNCECRRDSESIQKHMEMLTETLQAPLAGNPWMAFLHNFSLPTDVKIKDCMQNTTEVAQELQSLTNISQNTINMVMESSIAYPKFLSSALTAILVGRCDVEALSPLLTFPAEDSPADAVKEICSLPPQELYTMTVLLLQNLNVRNVIYKIKLPSDVDKLLNMLLDVVSNVSSLLNKAQSIFENLPAFLQTLKSAPMLDISSFQSIFQNRQPRSLAVGSLQSLIKGVCKEDSSFFSNTNMFMDMPRITEVLEEDMVKFSIPEDSTQFCLQLYQEILQSPNGALIWTFLKPLLHGKILYTPNTKNINLVMQKANWTFGFVENLKTYSEAWLRMTELVKHSENFLMISQLQEALQNSFIKNFVESQLDLDVGELMEKLQVYETMIEKMLNNSVTEQINLLAQLMGNLSSCLLLDRFQPVESVEKLEAKAHELMQQNNFLASIIFNASSHKRDGTDIVQELPKHVSYTIRTSILYSLRTDLIKNPVWKSHPQNLPADGFKYNHIFIPLQDMIERAIISVHTGVDALDAGIQVQAMPYPCHTSDLFLNNIGFFFPLIMMLTWMVSVASMVRKLVYEREIHLEEYMRTMGVPQSIHFLAWFLENFVVLTISSCVLTVILKVSGIFAYSNCFLVFLFFLDFGVSIAMFSYLLSVFFDSANTAALCASLIYMISFLPYVILLILQNQLSFANQTFVCFLSTTAFGQGVFLLTLLEGQELGIQWKNIYQPLAKGGPMTFGWACWMILLDSIIYFIVGWYFSNIIPGKTRRFGLRRPWHFPFTLTYWKNIFGVRSKKQSFLNPALFVVSEHFQGIDCFPKEQKKSGEEENQVGVLLRSLTKDYSESNKIAVKDLSLAFYKGHITALLGPNGAGKTTVISMLTGLFPPSSGNIIVNGKDMETDLVAIWNEMGVCPQYDVLFDSLTVQEHLLLYGTVKAPLWTKTQLHQHVTRALKDVGLFQHQDKFIRALSGGMKRRLSIAISFIGNSKTVVLDEPTSSVDPCSRRGIWDILLKYKEGRTLIFTTHHLDEAEALSDRIAILQHGQLRCCGSPSYLKETYGQGHSLTFTKKPSVSAFEDPRDTLCVTALVQAYLPEAFLKEDSGSELTYMIPTQVEKASFKGLFQALDENLQYLHMTGYGISDTTLEEVFLKLLQPTEKTPQIPVVVDMEFTWPNGGESTHKNGNSVMEAQSICGARLVCTQIAALLMKRLHCTQRDWRGTLSNVLLPVIFVAMAMALFTVKPLAIDYPSLKLTPGLYDNAETFFSDQGDDLPRVLMRYFTDEDDLCMHSGHGVRNDLCWQTTSDPQEEPLAWCECAVGQEKCPPFNISAPYMKNKKGHTLYNLSALNIEEYLIRPSNKVRFGGWSFGERLSIEPQITKVKKSYHKSMAKVWYNQKGFHALPSYLNQLNNFILWKNLPSKVDWKQYGITLYSCPYGGALLDEDKIMENVRQCGVALCIVLGFSILTASIGSSVVKDRVSGAKRLQHITGLGYKTYWFANFLYDMLLYLVPVSLCIGVITVFQLSAFTFRENLAATALLLILFGYATIPWMYLMSRIFTSSDIAFISYISLNFVCGLCTMLVTLLPRLLAVISRGKSFQNIYSILKWTFIIFPQFCLGQGLIELAYNQIKFDLTSNFGINSYVTPFEMNFLGWIFAEMALQGTLLLLLRILLNWDLLQKLRGHRYITNTFVPPSEDIDVELERKRLFGGANANDLLLLYNLQKSYQGFCKRSTAVKGITLGIQRGECFGLLGVNGAGKSTTFKMLTGDVIPSAGRAVIQTPTGSELDILSALSQGIRIGYCPQQDALDALLTGWEHLYYYCSLRGIPKCRVHKVAGDLVSQLHLDAHAGELVGTYSGGTKRKLSTALALVGKPHLLLLDEPSSGMDPCSKRYLWNTITKEVQDGCAAVLTSHSMEECEALCTRLAVMVNGSFKCLGSPQHIKNRFGDGYSVKVWLSKETSGQNAITECLQFHFPGALFKVFINFATQDQEDSNSAQGSCTSHDRHLPA